MERSLRRLKTNLNEELNVYIDDDTGDEYVYDGSKLVRIKVGTKEIGAKGDEDIQAQEEAERNKEAADGGVIETKDELEARVKKLQDALNDTEMAKEITKEANDRVAREKTKNELRKTEQELKKFRNDPIIQFEGSLNKFIKKQIALIEEPSYARFNKKYDGTGLIRKGMRRYEDESKISVQVYFDRSGSWDESKTKIGRQAIATLDKYVRTGKLTVKISYFNHEVFDTYTEKGTDGTWGSPILADILAKKPDNVIIMTDSDIDDCKEFVEVKGVVWYLFVDGVSNNLKEHLTGKLATESFELYTKGD